MFLPRALSAIVDASNALERLTVVFDAEVLDKPQHIDITAKLGISVRDATFEWSTAEPIVDEKPKRGGRGDNGGTKKKGGKGGKKEVAEAEKKKPDEGLEPFKVRGLTLEVERGSLCALVGAVGSGKSSILQGLIGEMKQTGGEVVFGGKVAYCPQTACESRLAHAITPTRSSLIKLLRGQSFRTRGELSLPYRSR
jgi:ATP-binding cassette, subfamily C (CFTR/MRP), member 1